MAPPSSRSRTQQDSKVKLDRWIGGEEGNTNSMKRLIKEMEKQNEKADGKNERKHKRESGRTIGKN